MTESKFEVCDVEGLEPHQTSPNGSSPAHPPQGILNVDKCLASVVQRPVPGTGGSRGHLLHRIIELCTDQTIFGNLTFSEVFHTR